MCVEIIKIFIKGFRLLVMGLAFVPSWLFDSVFYDLYFNFSNLKVKFLLSCVIKKVC